MKKIIIFSIFVLITSFLFADIDETALFSSQETVVSVPQISQKTENTTTFSGEVQYINLNIESEKNRTLSYMLGNFFLDVRKQNGVKAFANVQAYSLSADTSTVVNLKEFFMDFNSKNKIYFRAGKQVLQWGRCMLWNPTDFVNIDKQTFLTRIGYREGTNGIKLHIPFGTKYNFYNFLNFTDAQEFGDQSLASKFEFLIENTEMAFSVFTKKNSYSAYGYDFSTRFLKIDLYGEVSVSDGDNSQKVRVENGILKKYRDNNWTTKSSIGLNKNFDSPNFNDRYSVRTEFFYNSDGYTENIFKDKTLYPTETKAEFINNSEIYEANYHSKYYAAIFTSMNRFILPDITLNLNFINNLCDYSNITSIGVTHTDLNDFTVGVTLNAYGGNSDGEYSYSKDKLMTQLTISLSF